MWRSKYWKARYWKVRYWAGGTFTPPSLPFTQVFRGRDDSRLTVLGSDDSQIYRGRDDSDVFTGEE